MLAWEQLTKGKVEFASDLISSTITYWFGDQVSDQVSDQASEQVQKIIDIIRDATFSMGEIITRLGIARRRYVITNFLKPAIDGGYVLRSYPDKTSHPKQRYYLSEKGLKLVK